MGQTTEELNTKIAQTREDLADDLEALQQKVSPAAAFQRRKEAVSSGVRGLGSRIMGSTTSASRNANAASPSQEGLMATATSTVSAAENQVEGSPLAAGLVAFGVGMVLAGLMPGTEAESRAARAVMDTAREQGAPIADAAKSAAQQVGDELRAQASSAAAEVKQTAQDSAARVKDESETAADHIRT